MAAVYYHKMQGSGQRKLNEQGITERQLGQAAVFVDELTVTVILDLHFGQVVTTLFPLRALLNLLANCCSLRLNEGLLLNENLLIITPPFSSRFKL